MVKTIIINIIFRYQHIFYFLGNINVIISIWKIFTHIYQNNNNHHNMLNVDRYVPMSIYKCMVDCNIYIWNKNALI